MMTHLVDISRLHSVTGSMSGHRLLQQYQVLFIDYRNKTLTVVHRLYTR